ncbi:unnamed protein product [Caenorhabditis angaria]|uniref:Granulins domain-containing protein n=1 Tax=Caenorhabditis angaria TaxID=860376 RepID=A0A9P1I504_9PELO|nr:unnamed protein product [Caenorhabditis angaria]
MRLVILTLFFIFTIVNCRQCDFETSCSDDETCCKLGDNLWGCCPMNNAVCCDDHTHCCPSGTQCDTQGSRCIQGNVFHSPMQKKKPATKNVLRNEFNEIICPDNASKCPDGSTCCLLEQGTYGCCPVPNAVCCPDMLHCCPNGFTCHGQFCSQNFARIPHLKKFKSTSIHRKPAVNFMNSEESDSSESDDLPQSLSPLKCGLDKTCPAKTTCCAVSNSNGGFNHMCCPLSNAVCCSNTCCPNGYHCIEGGKCEKNASPKYGWQSIQNDY